MKYEKEFPLFKTTVRGVTTTFNLSDSKERSAYFEAKAGKEIALLKEYLSANTFIAYLLGKKNAGKGTYTKLMIEIFGAHKIRHISVGDVVRSVQKAFVLGDEEKKASLTAFLQKRYRGFAPFEEGLNELINWKITTLLPTELILALVEYEISLSPRKALFIDGFPRELDQVSYSLYFRNLIDYRSDPDIFVAIDIPDAVIDERIKYRAVCPTCGSPRNLKLFTTKEVGYDKEAKTFFLRCDNPTCAMVGARMVGKEGDSLGIEPIRKRLELDGTLIDKVFSLHGIPRILLRNSVPVKRASEYVDAYEITPAYSYEYDEATGAVRTIETPWSVRDAEGEEVYSLLAPPVVVSLIKQLCQSLGLCGEGKK